MIPRILHQVWVGPRPLPSEFEAYRQTWARKHPAWDIRLWNEENLPPDLTRPEVYERLRVPAERADILRLEVLNRYGGVYCDIDFECLRALDPLLEGVDFFTAYLKPNRVNNAIIGSVPGHPILVEALAELRPVTTYGYDKAAAGPHFFDSLLKRHPEATIFAPQLFYPNGPAERRGAFAVHHAARTWKQDGEFRGAALLAEERLERARAELDRANAEIRLLKGRLELRAERSPQAALRVVSAALVRPLHPLRILAVRARHRFRRVRQSARHVPALLRRKLVRFM